MKCLPAFLKRELVLNWFSEQIFENNIENENERKVSTQCIHCELKYLCMEALSNIASGEFMCILNKEKLYGQVCH